MKLLAPLEMALNEARNILFHLLGTDPGSPSEGQFWYNTTTHILRYRNNTRTVDVTDQYVTGLSVHNGLENSGSALAPNIGVQASGLVDAQIAAAAAIAFSKLAAPAADFSMNSHKITNVTDPSGAQDAATKAYVDAARQGLDAKDAVRAATTANITLSGTQTIDGVVLVAGDRVLVKNQTTASGNGIYVVAAGAWSRAADADASAEVTNGMYTLTSEGTTNAGAGWVLTTDDPIVLGTTALTFIQFTAAGTILAGTGLQKIGNTLSVDPAYTTPILEGGTGATTAAGARTALGVPGKFAVDVGDGTSTAITVTHNLGTKDVIARLRDNTTPWAYYEPDIEATTTNTLTLRFTTAPTSAQYRCVVLG
jgi:hypothetical protein